MKVRSEGVGSEQRRERQDIYSGRPIEWRWVLVGALIVLGLESLLGTTLAALGVEVASLGSLLFATTVAFLVGGGVIGWLSPGYTPWEAGFASVLAGTGTVFLAVRLLNFGEGFLVTLPIVMGWGLLCGLAGGYLGERIQGSEGKTDSTS